MPFGYYNGLNHRQKRIYQESDRVWALPLPDSAALQPLALKIQAALDSGRLDRTQKWSQALLHAITLQLGIRPIRLELLDVRPSNSKMELHGLYYPTEGRTLPRMKLWMRTAKRRQVVAFKTFLRTLLHEVCHHLDYECLKLKDSFHTEGFLRRESSLVQQILPPVVPISHSRRAKAHLNKMPTTKAV
ncbi:MAG: hypothetical protein KC563_05770 [Nitrospira sp.]|nr:hypothetical protein [Nitrospira sp.]MCA9475299.1 hypothetical protein [Nitrospira sp.]MCB9709672.1 hypothetical protein [Nitrospiraceae bacterium]MDR4486165.1 hypothetical protein [Nitrospirales bacterium]